MPATDNRLINSILNIIDGVTCKFL